MIRKAIQLLLFDLTISVDFGALFYSSFSLPNPFSQAASFHREGSQTKLRIFGGLIEYDQAKNPLHAQITSRPTIKLNL